MPFRARIIAITIALINVVMVMDWDQLGKAKIINR